MQKIWFKQKYFEQIQNGQKTQTLRFWKRPLKLQKGDKFKCFFGFNHQELIKKIEDFREVFFKNLSLEEIKNDGYFCKKSLKKDLIKYYPNFDENKNKLYLIKFK